MDKKTFVMYISWGAAIDNMDDHEAAAFLRMVYALERGEAEPDDIPDGLRIFWPLAKDKLCEDIETYKATCDKRAEAGRKGNQKRWENSKNRNCDNSDSKASQKSHKVASIADNESEYESEYEYDNTLKGVNNARARETTEMDGIDPAKLESYFQDQRISLALSSWFVDRAQDGRFSFKAMTDEIQRAQAAEKKYGADAVIDTIKASYSYKRIVWDRLERSQPKARSGTEDGTDYLLRRIAEEEAKEAQNDKNRSA